MTATPDPQEPSGSHPAPGPYGAAPQQPAVQPPAAGLYPPPGQHPAQPVPGARFGTMPYGAGMAPGVVPEPPQHRRLLMLTLASAAVYLLSALPGFFNMEAMRDFMREAAIQDPSVPAGDVEPMLEFIQRLTVVSMIAGVILSLGLYALVYFGLRAVKGWARVLGVVLAILGSLNALMSLFSFLLFDGLFGVLISAAALAMIVVNILWLVTAFNGDEAAYTRQGRVAA